MAEIRQLRYVLAVAEHGSVSRAATELHLSQSALSEALRKLELELGVELFSRGGRGVTPTAAGEALLTAGAEAVAGVRRGARRRRGQTGRLRVGFEATGAGGCPRSHGRGSWPASRTSAWSRAATTGAAR